MTEMSLTITVSADEIQEESNSLSIYVTLDTSENYPNNEKEFNSLNRTEKEVYRILTDIFKKHVETLQSQEDTVGVQEAPKTIQ